MTIFTIDSREFGWDEIIIAAGVWGEWRPFVETVRCTLACLRLAASTGRMPPAAEVREAATSFRYAHNLISAEDARRWLDRSGLTVEGWMECLRGQLLYEHWAGRLDQIAAAHPVSDAEVERVIRRYAVCSGKLELWARKLAGRAAVAARAGSLDAGDRSPLDLIGHIEAEFERQRQQAVTPKLIESRIADRRLDWIRFDCRYIWFPEERIAHEAAFCVTEDGLTLEEVARDARFVVQRWGFYLDEIETSARPRFLAARKGDWLGPVSMLEGFALFSIVAKTMPAAADPHIRERAEQAIVASLTEQAMGERVKWAAL